MLLSSCCQLINILLTYPSQFPTSLSVLIMSSDSSSSTNEDIIVIDYDDISNYNPEQILLETPKGAMHLSQGDTW